MIKAIYLSTFMIFYFQYHWQPGLFNGNECICSRNQPDSSMEYVRNELEDETCNVTCSGHSEFVCGGTNAVNVYIASMKPIIIINALM